jgi:hypothetical protein
MKGLKYVIEPLEAFINRRRSEIEAAKRYAAQNPDTFILVDPGDEVICDFCNAEVMENPVFILDGINLVCPECRKSMHDDT